MSAVCFPTFFVSILANHRYEASPLQRRARLEAFVDFLIDQVFCSCGSVPCSRQESNDLGQALARAFARVSDGSSP